MRGTSTDSQGNFSITATQSDSIVISLVGYESITLPLKDWEPGIIRLSERSILLNAVVVDGTPINYDRMFDEINARIASRKVPFYYSRIKKEKLRLSWLREDNARAQTYINLVVKNPEIKNNQMSKHNLTEKEYYDILTRFNEANYSIMYHLTTGELAMLINSFFEKNAPKK